MTEECKCFVWRRHAESRLRQMATLLSVVSFLMLCEGSQDSCRRRVSRRNSGRLLMSVEMGVFNRGVPLSGQHSPYLGRPCLGRGGGCSLLQQSGGGCRNAGHHQKPLLQPLKKLKHADYIFISNRIEKEEILSSCYYPSRQRKEPQNSCCCRSASGSGLKYNLDA